MHVLGIQGFGRDGGTRVSTLPYSEVRINQLVGRLSAFRGPGMMGWAQYGYGPHVDLGFDVIILYAG